jgi:protoporphyrinogen oxidase
MQHVEHVIIGAGPAGLTAAYEISKRTPGITVFESSNHVGGLARSFSLWGQTVDVGPHRFFSSDRRVNELWLEIVGRDYRMVNRQTRLLFNSKFFHYPLRAFDALLKLSPFETAKCVTSYAREMAFPTAQDGSFESWVCSRFGRRLFELFFKTYSEKLWGISCNELDADFAAQRIKKFSLWEAARSAMFPKNGTKHRTLVDQFAYPIEGTGMVYQRMAKAVQERGGSVRLNSAVQKVVVENKRVVAVDLASGERIACDQVISTMPLTVMVRQLDGVPDEVVDAANKLTFRNTILVYLEILNENPFTDNWIYVHSPDVSFGRVTNFRNWVPQICGSSPHSILVLEYWCNSDDPIWKSDESVLTARAHDDIVRSGLVANAAKLGRSSVLRIPKSYPVYRRGYREYVKIIQDYLSTIAGMQVIGRYGSFKYNNQDHSILMGRLAAENVLSKKENDLWSVNSDYDTYQEACTITDSGLVSSATSH